jgi:enoyl-CoA hydratase
LTRASFGIFCRSFGVSLIDLGIMRLPRLIGHSPAIALAKQIAQFPQACLGADRLLALRQWDLSE